MQFEQTLLRGTLLRRYKRFLADVVLENGETVTVHTPNTGSMMGCSDPGCTVWLLDTGNPNRKYPLAWELTQLADGGFVGVNTGRPNHLVLEAVQQGVIRELQGYRRARQEVRYGSEKSRIDLLFEEHDDGRPCYVELKNVTARDEAGVAIFPDAVSARGTKHLRELMGVVEAGGRGVILFCVQRSDVHVLRPADEIDPLYGQTLREAMASGVEALAYRAEISPRGIALTTSLPVRCQ